MMMLYKYHNFTVVLVVILSTYMKLVICDCRETFQVICDSAEDVATYEFTKRSWTHLSIESKQEDYRRNYTLKRHDLIGLMKLEQLIIINQFKRIEYKSFDHVGLKENLRYLVLYGNNFDYYLRRHTFMFKHLRKLSLVNNEITFIDPCVFQDSVMEVLDLSHNSQYKLPNYMFCECSVTKLIVRNNTLSKIEPNALPANLKYLYLDHNNLNVFSPSGLNNTDQLEELTLSHNNLMYIEHFESLQNLKKLDLSFNKFYGITNEFDQLMNLRVLNLSHNILMRFPFPRFVTTDQNGSFLILLAFNRLRNLDLTPHFGQNRVTLVLFGNPWNCRCIEEIENSTKIEMILRCGTFLRGEAPYCAINRFYTEECSSDQINDEHFHSFRKLSSGEKCNVNAIYQESSLFVLHPLSFLLYLIKKI